MPAHEVRNDASVAHGLAALTGTQRLDACGVTFLAAALLGNQLQHEVLYTVDGVVYALVGKELSVRPLSEWALLTWQGRPFFEHPHLTPWLLAASMKVLGVSTFSVLLPIVLLSVATVVLTYRLGLALLGHGFGLLAATVLALTPEFIRGGRNPMLEPALMFSVMLAVHSHVISTLPGRFVRGTVGVGVATGLALLAKGPPAVLALAVIAFFQAAARLFPTAFDGFALTARQCATQCGALVVVPAAMVLAVDLWYRHLTGTSFFGHYLGNQLQFTIVEGRGAVANDWTYYARTFVRDWPWWPFAVGGIALVVWRRDRVALPAATVGAGVTVGTYLGFSLMAHRAEWYVAIHHVGTSLLAALALRSLVPDRMLAAYFQRFVLAITLPLLTLSAIVPSLFLQYGRPLERFLDQAQTELGERLAGVPVADCIGLEPWKGPFLVAFYLGTTRTACGDPIARVKLVDTRRYVTGPGDTLVFSQQPFSLVSSPGVH